MISVTAISSGDPDLVVSRGIQSMPTPDDNEWSSAGFNSDQLFIEDDNLEGDLMY